MNKQIKQPTRKEYLQSIVAQYGVPALNQQESEEWDELIYASNDDV